MKPRLMLVVLSASLAVMCAAVPAQAQPSLARARELYAAANYDEALMMFTTLGAGLSGDTARSEDAATIAMYRVLCLVAVGRNSEVDAAIDRLVSQHPLYRPPRRHPSAPDRTRAGRIRLRPQSGRAWHAIFHATSRRTRVQPRHRRNTGRSEPAPV